MRRQPSHTKVHNGLAAKCKKAVERKDLATGKAYLTQPCPAEPRLSCPLELTHPVILRHRPISAPCLRDMIDKERLIIRAIYGQNSDNSGTFRGGSRKASGITMQSLPCTRVHALILPIISDASLIRRAQRVSCAPSIMENAASRVQNLTIKQCSLTFTFA